MQEQLREREDKKKNGLKGLGIGERRAVNEERGLKSKGKIVNNGASWKDRSVNIKEETKERGEIGS